MSTPLVDPQDRDEVAAVLADTQRLMGYDGVLDLLARLPGVELLPGRPARIFRPAVAASVCVGAEHLLSGGEPVTHQHVVGGVVLQRSTVPPGELPALLAGLVGSLCRQQGSGPEAATVLTAAREVVRQL